MLLIIPLTGVTKKGFSSSWGIPDYRIYSVPFLNILTKVTALTVIPLRV